MSYYYGYYIGYKLNNKIYPLGPYTKNGCITPVVYRSHSFASDLCDLFFSVTKNQETEELKKTFGFKNYQGEDVLSVKYLPLSELPKGSYLRKGYFLIEDVQRYESNPEEQQDFPLFEGFFDRLTPAVYAAKLQYELQFGPPKEKEDVEGNSYQPHAASDYMYYVFPDYNSKEYEAFLLRTAAHSLINYNSLPQDATCVILETEG